jgi:glycosyltransferase involved in cell wall biosynthesis
VAAVHNLENIGRPSTRNRGIEKGKGEIVAFLDDDDQWLPEFLARHVERHRQLPEFGLVYSGILAKWSDGILHDKVVEAQEPPEDIPSAMLAGEFSATCGSNMSIKTECLRQVGDFDGELEQFEDWDLYYRIGQAFPMAHISAPLTIYSLHLGTKATTDLHCRLAHIEAIIKKWGGDGDTARFRQRFRFGAHFLAARSNILKGDRLQALKLFKGMLNDFNSSSHDIYLTAYLATLFILGSRNFKRLQWLLASVR